jgi:hypothetical protein
MVEFDFLLDPAKLSGLSIKMSRQVAEQIQAHFSEAMGAFSKCGKPP